MLTEARQAAEPFVLVYSRLLPSSSSTTTEAWRTASMRVTEKEEGGGAGDRGVASFVISVDASGVETCVSLPRSASAGGGGGGDGGYRRGGGDAKRAGGVPCSVEEVAQQRELGGWERMLGVWNPHPIVEGMTLQLHCFGP